MWQFHKNCTCSQESDCICTGSPSKLNSFTARASSVRKLGATGFGSICCSLALRRCTNDNWKLWNSYDFRFFRFRMNSDAKSTHLDGSSQLGNLLGTQRDSEPWEAVGGQKGYSLTSTQANIGYMAICIYMLCYDIKSLCDCILTGTCDVKATAPMDTAISKMIQQKNCNEQKKWALEQIWALEILKMLIMIGCHGVQGLFLFASESTF